MSAFPGTPRTLKGALVAIDPLVPVPTVVLFQYNPHTLTRQLEARGADGGPAATSYTGAPVETINVEVELDATDGLETQDPLAVSLGVHPQLAALEKLVYPPSARIIANTVLAALGSIEVVPPQGPLILFIWGPRRVLPVSVKQFSIVEEAHDPQLNPIRARVSLGLRVLSTDDLGPMHPGHALFLAHQIAKEVMAGLASVTSTASALSAS
ncbi:hypothetical protein SOCEGT47_038560 [Sorangium cellulosum]|uniref:Uncharacterized protein n=1 Tax=Sorangium cellulosum TaxID=56 RepID=A0A4P2Q373_SORCE|nr:hypothetical protein [Sorangium cellulosum]AUX23333.1 hypothetical protein SOCEGT47_038560 [Sorangium cellulosum]